MNYNFEAVIVNISDVVANFIRDEQSLQGLEP